jgi:hypothetical protein
MRTDNAADLWPNATLKNFIFYILPMYEFSHRLGHLRTWRTPITMSALPPKAGIRRQLFDVRFVPEAEVSSG